MDFKTLEEYESKQREDGVEDGAEGESNGEVKESMIASEAELQKMKKYHLFSLSFLPFFIYLSSFSFSYLLSCIIVLFCFVLFCFVLFCFVLFCFVLFCFVLFCFVLFCFVLFCFVLFCFVF